MGAALDSFVITVEYAGIVAIVLIAFCLISRHKNNSGNLNVFQRMPLLLPALGFVLTIIIVANLGLTPMSQYQGVNSHQLYFYDGENITFTLRDQEFYSHSLRIFGTSYLGDSDSIYIDVYISQDNVLVDTITFDVQYSSIQPAATFQETITLDPGTYNLQVNFTRYHGVIPEEEWALQITVSQPLIQGVTEEIVDWSTMQFALNIGSIFFILGGLCIGSSTKKPPKKDEIDWKTTTEYEY